MDKMETDQQKIGIVDQFILAVSKPKEYKKLILLKPGKVIVYTLLMAVILTVMSYVIPVAGWLLSYRGFEGFVKNQIPEFSFSNGQFTMKSEIVIEQAGVSRVIVDTSKKEVTKEDLKEDYPQQILVSKNNMLISSMNTIKEIKFKDFKTVSFDKTSFLKLMPTFYLAVVISAVIQFLIILFEYVLSAFFYGLIALLYKGMDRHPVPLKDAMKAAIYAKTLSALLGAFNAVMGSVIPSGLWSFLSMFITTLLLLMGLRLDDGKEQRHFLGN